MKKFVGKREKRNDGNGRRKQFIHTKEMMVTKIEKKMEGKTSSNNTNIKIFSIT